MSESNELRLVAADIVHRLYKGRQVSQLNLLKQQIEVSLKEIKRKRTGIKVEYITKEGEGNGTGN
jgi:hypothetical protein